MVRAELEREIERLHEQSWAWALACCRRDQEAAEDALQSAYLRILSGRAHFDGRSSIKTWLFGVIRFTALEESRQHNLREARSIGIEAAEYAADAGIDAEIALEKQEEGAVLRAALDKISPRQREVLELVFYHDLTVEEAAAVMRTTVGTARVHYDRGKRALAERLAEGKDR